MSVKDRDAKDLIIKDGITGDVTVIHDFFTYSHYTMESILSDMVLPSLFDKRPLYISIGYKE